MKIRATLPDGRVEELDVEDYLVRLLLTRLHLPVDVKHPEGLRLEIPKKDR